MEKITKSSDKVLIDPNEPLILPDGTALVGRVEWFLYALCCLDYQNLPTPMSRIEEFANALITGEIPNIQPQSRAEQFFLAILDGNISDLPQPQSRSEVLLDKLARGEFDLSDVEPIQSRYELLLAYLIKNGGIGNIDYVLYEFSEAMKTMYNTVEKPFKSLELSGNTLVNCVLEDTENDDYTSFDKDYSGTSFTINGTSEGAIKSAILSGNTLVNVVSSYAFGGDSTLYESRFYDTPFNTGETFTIFVVNPNVTTIKVGLFNAITDIWERESVYNVSDNKKIVYTVPSDKLCKYVGVRVNTELDSTGFENSLVIVSGDKSNLEIENYFEGMQSVKMPVLTTTGKNLFDITKISNNITISSLNNRQTFIPNVNSIILWENTYNESGQFTVTIGGYNNGTVNLDWSYRIRFSYTDNTTDSGHQYIGSEGKSYTTASGKIVKNIMIDNPWNVNNYHIYIDSLQIEKNSINTLYEPYKSNILTVNEDIELRGIGDVQDELNLLTGELTQRIAEIVLDGSENWLIASEKTNTTVFYSLVTGPYAKKFDNRTETGEVNCDKFSCPSFDLGSEWTSDDEGCYTAFDGNICIAIAKSKLSTDNVDGLKHYLQSNPTTVQYELETPVVKTVALNVVDQNNTKIDKVHVFNEVTHVNTSSDELTPTVNIGKSVSYPTIIKPNTKYTVDLKRNDKPLTVNLGGTEVTFASGETRKTITTPSTLTNDKLSYYGVGAKCNEIMLIEGEIERNVDYFTGMQSVVMQNQMPILCTTGKNLFDKSKVKYNTTIIAGNGREEANNLYMSSDFISVKPNENYISNNMGVIFFYNENRQYIGEKNNGTVPQKFTTPVNCKYIRVRCWAQYSEVEKQKEVVESEQIEQDSTVTTYEPYKTSILSCNEDVALRGIGDVQDTLDCLTGEVMERVRENVLDGSDDEKWVLHTTTTNLINHYHFYMPISDLKKNSIPTSDRFVGMGYSERRDEEFISIGGSYHLHLNILRSRLEDGTIGSLKKYLSQNPITVQYELAEPIITTIDLNVVDQDGNTIPKIKSYNGVTHLEVTVPKQSLLPNVSAEVATDNSKDMSLLTTKHQEISETQSAIQDNIQSQSDEIDTALMATTEIFESILE